MTTLLYWQTILTSKECKYIEGDVKKTLELIAQGEYQRVNLKKLKTATSTPLYRAKINRSQRIIFTMVEHHGHPALLLLQILLDHRYERSAFLDDQYLNEYLGSIDPESLLEFINEAEDAEVEEAPILNLEGSSTDMSWQAAFNYHETKIYLDPDQQQVMEAALPIFIEGVAGSGKTCAGFARLINDAQLDEHIGASFCYVTLSSKLKESLESQWTSAVNQQALKAQTNFFIYRDFLLNFIRPERLVTIKHFSDWLSKRILRDDAKKLQEISLEIMIHEARFLSGFEHEIEDRVISIVEDEHRHLFRRIYQEYQRLLDHANLFNIQLSILPDSVLQEYLFDLIMIDEAQAFSGAQLRSIEKASKNKKMLIFYDYCQNLDDDLDHISLLKNKIKRTIPITEMSLTVGHRCKPAIATWANRVLDLRSLVSGKKKRTLGQLRINTESSLDHGNLIWLSPSDFLSDKVLSRFDRANCNWAIIVSSEEEFAAAQSVFPGFLSIFTQEQIRGLEYSTIVLWEPLKFLKTRQINELLGKNREERTAVHLSTQEMHEYRIILNKLFTSSTRAIDSLVIVSLSKPYQVLKEYFLDNAQVEGNSTIAKVSHHQASLDLEWQEKAKLILKQGGHESINLAQKIIEQHCPSVSWDSFLSKNKKIANHQPLLNPLTTKTPQDAAVISAGAGAHHIIERALVLTEKHNDALNSTLDEIASNLDETDIEISLISTIKLIDQIKSFNRDNIPEDFFNFFLTEESLTEACNYRYLFLNIDKSLWEIKSEELLQFESIQKNEKFKQQLQKFKDVSWLNALFLYAYTENEAFLRKFENLFFETGYNNGCPLIIFYVQTVLMDISRNNIHTFLIFHSPDFKDYLLRFYLTSLSSSQYKNGVNLLLSNHDFQFLLQNTAYHDPDVYFVDSTHAFFSFISGFNKSFQKNLKNLAQDILDANSAGFEGHYHQAQSELKKMNNVDFPEGILKTIDLFLLMLMAQSDRSSMYDLILDRFNFDLDFLVSHCQSLNFLKSKINFREVILKKIKRSSLENIHAFLEEKVQQFLKTFISLGELDFYLSLFPEFSSSIFENGERLEQYLLRQCGDRFNSLIYPIITGSYHYTQKSFQHLLQPNLIGRSFLDDLIERIYQDPLCIAEQVFLHYRAPGCSYRESVIRARKFILESNPIPEEAANYALQLIIKCIKNHTHEDVSVLNDFLCFKDSSGKNICDLIIERHDGFILGDELVNIAFKDLSTNSFYKIFELNRDAAPDSLIKIDYAAQFAAKDLKIIAPFDGISLPMNVFAHILGQTVVCTSEEELQSILRYSRPELIFKILNRFDRVNSNFSQILKRLDSISPESFVEHAHLIQKFIHFAMISRMALKIPLSITQTDQLLSKFYQSSNKCSDKLVELYEKNKITLNPNSRELRVNFETFATKLTDRHSLSNEMIEQADSAKVFTYILLEIAFVEEDLNIILKMLNIESMRPHVLSFFEIDRQHNYDQMIARLISPSFTDYAIRFKKMLLSSLEQSTSTFSNIHSVSLLLLNLPRYINGLFQMMGSSIQPNRVILDVYDYLKKKKQDDLEAFITNYGDWLEEMSINGAVDVNSLAHSISRSSQNDLAKLKVNEIKNPVFSRLEHAVGSSSRPITFTNSPPETLEREFAAKATAPK